MVTSGHREAADIGIAGGRIAQLGGTMTGAEELAAGGLLAIPGGVDAHTHLAASLLAVAGGLAGAGQTTVGPYLFVLVTVLDRQGQLEFPRFAQHIGLARSGADGTEERQ